MQKELKFIQILFQGFDIIVVVVVIIIIIIITKVLIQAELAWNLLKNLILKQKIFLWKLI